MAIPYKVSSRNQMRNTETNNRKRNLYMRQSNYLQLF